jgi:hypothetical protein
VLVFRVAELSQKHFASRKVANNKFSRILCKCVNELGGSGFLMVIETLLVVISELLNPTAVKNQS